VRPTFPPREIREIPLGAVPVWWVAPAALLIGGGSTDGTTTAVPEPSVLLLLATGLGLMDGYAHRRVRRGRAAAD
jgi:hypothetical protein